MDKDAFEQLKEDLQRSIKALQDWMTDLKADPARILLAYSSMVEEDGMLAVIARANAAEVTDGLVKADTAFPKVSQLTDLLTAIEQLHAPEELTDAQESQLRQVSAVVRDMLPRLRAKFEGAAKAGPQFRRGGRPPSMSSGLATAALADVDDLIDRGRSAAEANEKVAKKFDVSVSTIKRLRSASMRAKSKGNSAE